MGKAHRELVEKAAAGVESSRDRRPARRAETVKTPRSERTYRACTAAGPTATLLQRVRLWVRDRIDEDKA